MNKFKGSYKIIDNKYVIKKTNKDLRSLYEYFKSRNFNSYPYIYEIDENHIKNEYIEANDDIDYEYAIATTLSDMHYKTTKLKDVSINKYKEIYDKLLSNISYLTIYYDNMIKEIEIEKYLSPSKYLFERNYSIINYLLSFSKKSLDDWYSLTSNKEKERVTIVHNNLKRNKIIKGENYNIIGFDNYLVDTPIIDLYKLYLNEPNLDYIKFLKIYNENYKLSEEEKKLLLVLISIPNKIVFINNELLNCKNIKGIINNMYKCKKLIIKLEEEETE